MVASLLYGCGLRVSEPLNLRVKDVDLQRRRLCIRGAKGGNDRVVSLPGLYKALPMSGGRPLPTHLTARLTLPYG
jgi:integrase